MIDSLFTKKQNKIVSLSWNKPENWVLIANKLKKNQIALGASDTVMGLLAQCSSITFKKLNSIKKRFEKPYILLIDSIETLKNYCQDPLNEEMVAFIDHISPGPVTFLVKPAADLAFFYHGGKDTIALRIPAHAGLQAVIKDVGPLFSTSANISGEPTPTLLNEVNPALLPSISCILTQEQSPLSAPSTILDCTGKEIIIVREGAVSREVLEKAYRKPFGKKEA